MKSVVQVVLHTDIIGKFNYANIFHKWKEVASSLLLTCSQSSRYKPNLSDRLWVSNEETGIQQQISPKLQPQKANNWILGHQLET